jgi:phenylacetate-CoA ligase
LDTNTDVMRRTRTWQVALESGGVSAADRVLLALPLDWAVAWDAHLALRELAALTMVVEQATLDDVLGFRPTVLLSTPTDALRLAHSAAAQQDELADGPLRLAVLTAEPGASQVVTRRAIEDRWGAASMDVYALTELGVIGWGCPGRGDGIHLDDRDLHFDVLGPEGDEPVADGELGELAVTTPEDWASPLTCYRTDDLVRLRRDGCGCGRGSAWLEGGVLGRVDERLAVRGQMILPVLIEQIVRRHPAVIDYALRAYTVRGQCEVAVEIETTDVIGSEGDRARVAAEVAEDLKRSLGLRLQCDVVPPGSLSSAHTAGRRARRLRRQ